MKNLPIKAVEYVQDSIDGGHPLDNYNANANGMGHGTPLLVVSKRDMVDFLRRLNGELSTSTVSIHDDVVSMLDAWDTPVQ